MKLSPDQASACEQIRSWVYERCDTWREGRPAEVLKFSGYAGTGKGQPMTAEIMTPFGPKHMGDMRPGSQVSNPDGSTARVLLIHELGERDVYRVTFADGASTLVTDDHLWLVKRSGKHLKAKRTDMDGTPIVGRLETTQQLIAYLDLQKNLPRTFLPLIPLTEPVLFTAHNTAKLDVDPYVLGALIGDGSLCGDMAVLHSADPAMSVEIGRILGVELKATQLKRTTCLGYRIPAGTDVRGSIKAMGLWGHRAHEKFIPSKYMLGAIEERWGLVQGLMDTDGTVGRTGGVSFTTTSLRLSEEMRWVLMSLGFRVTVSTKNPTYWSNGEKKHGRLAYTLFIQGRNLKNLFRLDRKRERCLEKFNGGVSEVARRMVSIVPEGRALCRCITVDHPNGLYLTDGFIVTHNSTVLGVLADEFQKRNLLVAYATFTGRASTILSRKLADQGVITANRMMATSEKQLDGKFAKYFLKTGEERMPFCGTLHRLLYAPMINEETEELLGWRTRLKLDRRYGLIVTDESSMIGNRMLADIVRHGVPVLAVGDHGQLSPVLDEGSLMKDPDIRLEQIHRQASDNPIIQLSKIIRETGKIDRSLAGNAIVFGKRTDIGDVYLNALSHKDPSQGLGVFDWLDVGALCWTNKTRVATNRIVRKAFSFTGPPKMGETLICLRNFDDTFNGMRGILQRDAEPSGWTLDASIEFPFENVKGDYEMCGYQFHRPKPIANLEELQRLAPAIKTMGAAGKFFDFGYCATVHRFQGSQLKHAIGILDRPANPGDSEYRRWLYTLVTRSSEKLTVLT